MCKFVIFHSEEFKHPGYAFFLGALISMTNIFVEITNILYSLQQKRIEDVIGKFVSFKVLIQIQDYYLRQRANFRIAKGVQTEPLIVCADLTKIFGDN